MAETINGKGTAWEVKPGVYQFYFSLGKDPETGKYRKSPRRTLHCTRKNKRGREAELRSAMEAYKQELETGIVAPKSAAKTVGEYALEFHELRKGTMRSELSYEREKVDIDHINELFGAVKLMALNAPIIKAKYAQVRKEELFSESEIHKIHAKLSQIMKEAVQDELLTKNPCSSVSVPRPQPKERKSLSIEEAARLLECLSRDYEERKASNHSVSSTQSMPHLIGVMLLVTTGMRRGEMLGLTWEHVRFDKNDVYICQQYAKDCVLREPKSKKSKRAIHLDKTMINVLSEWKALQSEYLEAISARQTESSPVINNELGGHMNPDNFNRWFRGWCVKNDFGRYEGSCTEYRDANGVKRYRKTGYHGLTPHMLRHTHATLLIGASTDIKTVQARLGHSSIDLTLNIYSHAIAANDEKAAETFSSLVHL